MSKEAMVKKPKSQEEQTPAFKAVGSLKGLMKRVEKVDDPVRTGYTPVMAGVRF
jgi:hypothetical protein